MDALPLRYMSAGLLRHWCHELPGNLAGRADIFQDIELFSVRNVRFYPPPPSRLLYEGKCLFCVCGGRRCRQAARERNGVWLGRMPARPTLYHTLVMMCGRASHRVHPKMGASFWLPLGSYTGMLSPLLWTTPNLGCTPLTGRIADHWGDLPDHWRLRPVRWVWPHLTDNPLTCTHNHPGYTISVRICPNLGARSSQSPGLLHRLPSHARAPALLLLRPSVGRRCVVAPDVCCPDSDNGSPPKFGGAFWNLISLDRGDIRHYDSLGTIGIPQSGVTECRLCTPSDIHHFYVGA